MSEERGYFARHAWSSRHLPALFTVCILVRVGLGVSVMATPNCAWAAVVCALAGLALLYLPWATRDHPARYWYSWIGLHALAALAVFALLLAYLLDDADGCRYAAGAVVVAHALHGAVRVNRSGQL